MLGRENRGLAERIKVAPAQTIKKAATATRASVPLI
jgi:hypothetical protein